MGVFLEGRQLVKAEPVPQRLSRHFLVSKVHGSEFLVVQELEGEICKETSVGEVMTGEVDFATEEPVDVCKLDSEV